MTIPQKWDGVTQVTHVIKDKPMAERRLNNECYMPGIIGSIII